MRGDNNDNNYIIIIVMGSRSSVDRGRRATARTDQSCFRLGDYNAKLVSADPAVNVATTVNAR